MRRESETQRNSTLFVDNLPDQIRKVWLYNLFSKHGKIRDIFILNKKSKITGERFSLVRYEYYEDAEQAPSITNGAWVWNRKVVVKTARFLRRTDSLHNQFHSGVEINQERNRGSLHGQVQNTSRFNQEWNRGIQPEQRKMEAKRGQEQRNKRPQWKGKWKAIVPFQKTQIPTQKKLVSIYNK